MSLFTAKLQATRRITLPTPFPGTNVRGSRHWDSLVCAARASSRAREKAGPCLTQQRPDEEPTACSRAAGALQHKGDGSATSRNSHWIGTGI